MTAPTAIKVKTGLPKWVLALRVIGESDLDSAEMNLLRAVLHWVNLRTGEAWMSHGSLADHMGVTRGHVINIMKRLTDKGIVIKLRVSSGGTGAYRTNRYRFLLGRLHAAHAKKNQIALNAASNVSADAVEPAKQAHARTTLSAHPEHTGVRPACAKCVPGEHNPSMDLSKDPSKEHTNSVCAQSKHKAHAAGASEERKTTAASRRQFLAEKGVPRAVISLLAKSAALTIEVMTREWSDVIDDPGVTDRPGEYALRLADVAGLSLDEDSHSRLDESTPIGRIQAKRSAVARSQQTKQARLELGEHAATAVTGNDARPPLA